MKKSSRRTLSRFLAGVMLVTSVFGSAYVNAAETVDTADATVAVEESVTSDAAVAADTTADEVELYAELPDVAANDTTYTLDFKDGSIISADTSLNGTETVTNGFFTLSAGNKNAYGQNGAHGAMFKEGNTLAFKVAGPTKISVQGCQYSNEGNVTATDGADYTQTIAFTGTSHGGEQTCDTTMDFIYPVAAAATVTLTFEASTAYVTKIVVAPYEAPVIPEGSTSFELWLDDLAVDVAADDGTVTKTVEPGELTGTVGLKTGGSVDIGISKLELIGNGSEKFTPSIAAGQNLTFGSKEGVNAYKAGGRHATANDIPSIMTQGQGTAIVFTPAANGMFKTYFYTGGSFLRVWDFDTESGERYGYKDSESFAAAGTHAFNAERGHTYVLSTTGKTNNCAYAGFEYAIDVPVNVNFTWANDGLYSGHEDVTVTLHDVDLNEDVATVKYGETSAELMQGHTYELVSDDGGSEPQINGSVEFKVTEPDQTFDINSVVINDVTTTGEFVGADASVVTELTFTALNKKGEPKGDPFTATLTGNGYTIDLKPGDYETAVKADGYKTYDHLKVIRDTAGVNNVYLESTDSGYYVLPEEITAVTNGYASSITFSEGVKYNNSTSINAPANATLTIPVKGRQKVQVSGWYAGSWNINGGETVTADSSSNATSPVVAEYITDGTETSVTVNILEGPTYLYWVKIEDYGHEYKPEITVPGDFDTLSEAVAEIRAMERPEGEDGRVTIKLASDIQEQVVFDAPYITLDGQGNEINWYYGQTGYYYSVDPSTGLYNERLFQDKYSKTEGNGSLWGGVAIIRGDNFIAENTTFRNTFNYEVTDKEIEDGAENRGKVTGLITKDTDVTKYDAKERSNAFYVEAKNIELYDCKVLSSQDTFGRNGSGTGYGPVYAKNCVIGGNTDYICGEFALICDNCELQWKTFKGDDANNAKIGYITAPKTNPYIFRDCVVTTDGVATTGVKGCFGRTWGAGSNAAFLNTQTNGYINSEAWGEMSGGESATSKFAEYKTMNGDEAFETTGGTNTVTKLTDDQAALLLYNDVIDNALAGWTPKHYEFKVEPPTGLWGDADKSGILTANDAALVFAYSLDPKIASTLKEDGTRKYNFTACNVDNEGDITSNDAAMILQKVVDSSFEFPAEQVPTVFFVGDSTGCHYADTADATNYYKRVGYGDKLADYLTDNIKVNNLALSGRSSRTFLLDPEYATLTSSWKAGDYVLIAFGHNDEKLEAGKGSLPGGTKEDAGAADGSSFPSFKYSLYTNYIKPAQDAGVTPILVTPIVRRTTGATFSDSQKHIANGGDYAQSVKDLADELGILCVDATALTEAKYLEVGVGTEVAMDKASQTCTAEATGTAAFHAAGQNGAADNTHLNNYGAKMVAYLVTEAIKASDNPLAAYVKDGNVPPTEADIVVNKSWTFPVSNDLEGDALISQLWKTTAPWYGTVFGDCGGAEKLVPVTDESDGSTHLPFIGERVEAQKVPHYAIDEIEGGVHLRMGLHLDGSDTSTGKVAGTSDGVTFYYQPIDASGNYQISGTVTVNGCASHNQVAFGAAIFDSIKVDTYAQESYPYVAAGVFRTNEAGADILDADGQPTGQKNLAPASYARIEGALDYSNSRAIDAFDAGTQFNVTIKKVGDVFTTTTQRLAADGTPDGEAAVCTYTLPMSGIAYAGFYVARCADITVTNITTTNEVAE